MFSLNNLGNLFGSTPNISISNLFSGSLFGSGSSTSSGGGLFDTSKINSIVNDSIQNTLFGNNKKTHT